MFMHACVGHKINITYQFFLLRVLQGMAEEGEELQACLEGAEEGVEPQACREGAEEGEGLRVHLVVVEEEEGAELHQEEAPAAME
jgi:hypothetical protein